MHIGKLREIYADTTNGTLFGAQNSKVTFCTRVFTNDDDEQENHDIFTLVIPTDSLFDFCVDTLNGMIKNQSFFLSKGTELAGQLDAMLSAMSTAFEQTDVLEKIIESPPPSEPVKAKSKRKAS